MRTHARAYILCAIEEGTVRKYVNSYFNEDGEIKAPGLKPGATMTSMLFAYHWPKMMTAIAQEVITIFYNPESDRPTPSEHSLKWMLYS